MSFSQVQKDHLKRSVVTLICLKYFDEKKYSKLVSLSFLEFQKNELFLYS